MPFSQNFGIRSHGHDKRTLFLLAQHQDIQEKLRLEITEARIKHGDLAYDELASLQYLDAVCRETLRLHPPFSYLIRTCDLDSPQVFFL